MKAHQADKGHVFQTQATKVTRAKSFLSLNSTIREVDPPELEEAKEEVGRCRYFP